MDKCILDSNLLFFKRFLTEFQLFTRNVDTQLVVHWIDTTTTIDICSMLRFFFMLKHCSNSPFHCHILYFLHHSYFLLQTQSSISLKCVYFFVCLQAGGSSGLLMDLAANEKDVHADFFNGKKLMSSKCFESLKMRLKVQPDFLFEIYQLVQWFKQKNMGNWSVWLKFKLINVIGSWPKFFADQN